MGAGIEGVFLELLKAIEEATSKSEKKKFIQTVDIILNIKDVDFSKPENRLDLEIPLPAGRGKQVKVAVIAGDELMIEAKKTADKVITKEEIPKIASDKKALKKLAKEFGYFIAQSDLMVLIGKNFGPILAPRGKMPKPVPGSAKLQPIVDRYKKLVRVKTKGKFLPTFHAPIGTEEMKKEDLGKNADAVINAVVEKLPNKIGSIKSIFIKTTMGPIVRVQL